MQAFHDDWSSFISSRSPESSQEVLYMGVLELSQDLVIDRSHSFPPCTFATLYLLFQKDFLQLIIIGQICWSEILSGFDYLEMSFHFFKDSFARQNS